MLWNRGVGKMVVGEMVEQRDLVIIGGGPAGYQAAIRAAQLDLNVTLIEKSKLGGICLHKGCIPSKVFAHAAKKFRETKELSSFGITTGEAVFSMTKLGTYQERVIENLHKGIKSLCQANQIEVIEGEVNFISEHRLGVSRGHQFDLYEFTHAIIATGGKMKIPEIFPAKNEKILHADNIYHMKELPSDLIVYGNDYIALEVAFSFNQLGTEVTIVLEENDFSFDQSINRELRRLLKKERMTLIRNTTIETITSTETNIEVTYQNKEKSHKITGSHLFVSGEIRPNIESLGLDRIGVSLCEKGLIETDKTMKTSVDHIYAAGDVTSGPSLAVKAIKQGKVAAEIIAGLNNEVDLTFIPMVIHTSPPIASIGLTEQQATEYEHAIEVSQFSLSGNGYASITNERAGFVKLIKDANTGILVGFHMIGDGAVELASTGITSLEMAAREEDLNFPFYPHPSYNEAILEAIENFTGTAIHMTPVKKE